MDKNNSKDCQDKLDEYQAAWVIGKQRGEESPLNKEKLEKLVRSGRVSWDWLGEDEKKLFGNKKIQVIDL